MNTKHTAGPWKYNPDFSAVVVIRDYKVKAVADFGKTDLLETEANARLVAAAPELLEALANLLHYDTFEQVAPKAGTREYEVISMARAVIAKATGQ